MAHMNITIPDDAVDRVSEAFAANYGYLERLPDGSDNPQSKAEFSKAQVVRFVTENVQAYETAAAVELARESALSGASSDVGIS